MDHPDAAGALSAAGQCRGCRGPLGEPAVDLGPIPAPDWYPGPADLDQPDPTWPLRVFVCERCWLVQLDDGGPDELPSASVPASAVSTTLADHVQRHVTELVGGRGRRSGRVLVMASHGLDLAGFLSREGVEASVVEGDLDRAAALRARGTDVVTGAFGPVPAATWAEAGGAADLLIDHFELAHRRDPNTYAAGLAIALAEDGTASIEFDHVLSILEGHQFDAFRHGHFSYLSLTSLSAILERHGLVVIAATEHPVYGGAVRVRVRHAAAATRERSIEALMDREARAGLRSMATYARLGDAVNVVRSDVLAFLEGARVSGRAVAGYGAPSRATTFLNACRITPDLMPFTVDAATGKHGRYVPGVRIPIDAPTRLRKSRPDHILVLTWDLADEIVGQLRDLRTAGTLLHVAIPRLRSVG